MKYTLKTTRDPTQYWNGTRTLPAEIHVIGHDRDATEWELLRILCSLHGYLTAFDILMGGEPHTEKEADIVAVLTAFQHYLYPKMPLSRYTGSDKRMVKESADSGSSPMNRYE